MTSTEPGSRVAVVGAGIIGTTVALVLQRQGYRVTLIDRNMPGMGCSYGNGGAISPDQCIPIPMPGMLKRVPGWLLDSQGPLVIRWRNLPSSLPWLVQWVAASRVQRVLASSAAMRELHAPSLNRYYQLLGDHSSSLLEKTGQLFVWKGERSGLSEQLAMSLRKQYSVAMTVLSPADIQELDPNLDRSYTHGLFFPENAHTLNPLRLVQTLATQMQIAGGHLKRAEMLDFDVVSDASGQIVRRIRCQGFDIEVDAVVISAGIDSKRLASLLGEKVSLQAERGYHVMLPDPGIRPVVKVSDRDHMFAITPMEHGLRISGTVEITSADAPMDERRPRAMLAHAKRMYPALNDREATFWMGNRPSTPDGLPIIDRASRTRNVILAFGHGHFGLSGAPMTAELVAYLLSETGKSGSPPIEPGPYRASRFRLF